MEKKESDEELLREFEWAKGHVTDDDIPQPDPDELRKILERVEKQEE